MRICFFSRRYFPAISGMSVYAQNLLRELTALAQAFQTWAKITGVAASA